jgi:hypothetical protein
MRSEHDTSRAMEPYRNQANVNNEQFYGGMGGVAGMIGGATMAGSNALRSRGASIPLDLVHILAGGGLGIAAGGIGGRIVDRSGVAPWALRGQPNMDTYGSEERIGAGQANQQPMDPRDPRRFRVYPL